VTSVQTIVVDPYLLCLPNPCHSVESLDSFVGSVLAWSDCLSHPNLDVRVSDVRKSGLFDDGQYPYQHRLRDLLSEFHVDYVDHETISRLVQTLLERTPSLEATCGLTNVLYDEEELDIEPEWYLTRLSDSSRNAFAETLVMLAVCCKWMSWDSSTSYIASTTSQHPDESTILVCSCIHDVETLDNTLQKSVGLPREIRGEFEVFGSYQDFLSNADSWTLWENARSEDGALKAIQAVVINLVEFGADEEAQIKAFALGPKFLESARR